jgi:hypothetical protein
MPTVPSMARAPVSSATVTVTVAVFVSEPASVIVYVKLSGPA